MIINLAEFVTNRYLIFYTLNNLRYESFEQLELKIKTYLKYDSKYFSEFTEELPSREYFKNIEENLVILRSEIISFFMNLVKREEIKINQIVDVEYEKFFEDFIRNIEEKRIEEKLKILGNEEINRKEELIEEIKKLKEIESKKRIVRLFEEEINNEYEYIELESSDLDFSNKWNQGIVFEYVILLYFKVLRKQEELKKK